MRPLGKTDRFGWNRPTTSMRRMNAKIRHKPDYYAENGFLVEVMGCGKDRTLKLKPDKYQALKDWNGDQPVTLFAYCSAENEWVLLDWAGLKKAVAAVRRDGLSSFNDGNQYWPLPWQLLSDLAITRGEG